MAVKTFVELETEEKPSADSVLETLSDYVNTSCAITPEVVLRVISNAGLSREELEKARECLQTGYNNQGKIFNVRAAREYETAKEGVERLLKQSV